MFLLFSETKMASGLRLTVTSLFRPAFSSVKFQSTLAQPSVAPVAAKVEKGECVPQPFPTFLCSVSIVSSLLNIVSA